jgi:hypothetical protein
VTFETVLLSLIPAVVGSVVSWVAFLHIRAAKLEIENQVNTGLQAIRREMASAEDMRRIERRLERLESPHFGRLSK